MYTNLTRGRSGCTDEKKPQGHVCAYRFLSVFVENSSLFTGTEINLSVVMNEDMSDDKKNNSSKVFLKIKYPTLSVPEFWVCVKVECKELTEKAMKIFVLHNPFFFIIIFLFFFLYETMFPAVVTA